MIVFLLKDDKQKSFNKDQKRKKRKENSYVCKYTTKKLRICSMRAVGYVNKVKDSFEPDSNQRPKDINYASTVLRSTN